VEECIAVVGLCALLELVGGEEEGLVDEGLDEVVHDSQMLTELFAGHQPGKGTSMGVSS